MVDQETINKVLGILKEEVVPAEGCTEPIALAYVAAKARQVLGEKPDCLRVWVSGNMIKNVKSVIVPNSGGMAGIEVAAAMGALAGNPDKELLVISDVRPEDMNGVREFVSRNRVEVNHEPTNIKLYIRIQANAGENSASVEVKHTHTNVTEVIKDGKEVLSRACKDTDFNSPLTDREILSIKLIHDMAGSIDLSLIRPVFRDVIALNSRIAEEGLEGSYGVNLGKCIRENIRKGIYGDDQRNRSASLAAAGSDARMSGCPFPVMTTSGSGNQGMAASLPVIQYARDNCLDEETLIRALFFSHLSTVHIKTRVGRLSAFCGVICASAAVSGAIAMLMGGNYEVVGSAIVNTLGNISGVICDGAKASCAMKIATGVYSAFDGAILSFNHKSLDFGDGIVGEDVEATIANIGELARSGMEQTDEVILGIMTRSGRKG
ncbi:MAG: L-serine ammonia-lyase, iron-sulfur-dependent, subunit alpha [Desulfobacterales bacterium]|nr:L-serine ammonia-lyase, iron-sulfur-dependent, subunit alpha [Desulfobacterales bacterium]